MPFLSNLVQSGLQYFFGSSPQEPQTFRPISTDATREAPRASTPTTELPYFNTHRIVRPVANRPSSVPADRMNGGIESLTSNLDQTAQRTTDAAREPLGQVEADLRRLDNDPTASTHSCNFSVDFGETVVDGNRVHHKKTLAYNLRHNGHGAKVNLMKLKKQAALTGCLLQKIYDHNLNLSLAIEAEDEDERLQAYHNLGILRDMQSYDLRFDKDHDHITLYVYDSNNNFIKHTFHGDFDVEYRGFERHVELSDYLNLSHELMHEAFNDKAFNKKCGHEFFEKYVASGRWVFPEQWDPRYNKQAQSGALNSANEVTRDAAWRDQRMNRMTDHLRDQVNQTNLTRQQYFG